MNKALLTLGSVFIAIALFVAGVGFGLAYAKPYLDKRDDKAATIVGTNFVKDITTDKVAEGYRLTSEVVQKKQTESSFAKDLGNLKSTGAYYETSKVVHDGSTIVYTQRVVGLPATASGSVTGLFTITLVSEKGAWKVNSVQIQ